MRAPAAAAAAVPRARRGGPTSISAVSCGIASAATATTARNTASKMAVAWWSEYRRKRSRAYAVDFVLAQQATHAVAQGACMHACPCPLTFGSGGPAGARERHARRARLAVRQGHVGLARVALRLQRAQAPAHSAWPEPFQPKALRALQRLRMA